MSSPVSDPRLDVEGVSVAYSNGHLALHDATFHLASGTICALVGVNGSGKSTLFKSIMGFVKPTAGSVTINGLPVLEAGSSDMGKLLAALTTQTGTNSMPGSSAPPAGAGSTSTDA